LTPRWKLDRSSTRLTSRLDPARPAEQLAEDCPQLGAGEVDAEAEVRPCPKTR
jgi:hypothetical protein